MKISHFFIERPRFATVISAVIIIFGIISYFALPITQYPEISPPQVQVNASYPGADAATVATTVAAPLEQAINGVEGMEYMSSRSSNDGSMTLSITFAPGTDEDAAQVLVQNRVSRAEARLPEAVRRMGVSTATNSSSFLLVVNLFSPQGTYDLSFLGNYASLEIGDKLNRVNGVGSTFTFGSSDYSMRLWFDPDRMASLNLTTQDVINAVRTQNIQVAGGTLNRSPMPIQNAFELSVQMQGRLVEPGEFENIIVKSGDNGALVRLKDVARVELGSESYSSRGYMGKNPSVAIPVTMRPGANALATSDAVLAELEVLAERFPEDLEYSVVYNPTNYIAESMKQLVTTLLLAMILVVFVVLVFLQNWRISIIPVIAIPISLVGTFAVMQSFGYSLNMLSLFGLILAIGIVVDDAIVVVESIERKLHEGIEIKTATKQTMNEVGTALIATSLVVAAVFLPTLVMEGITGQFYKQFGVTIASATLISTVVSLTLSPAMATIFMKNISRKEPNNIFSKAAQNFNRFMEKISGKYGFLVGKIIRMGGIMSIVYIALIGLTGFQLLKIPTGFIPPQDQGFLITIINLPAGASLERTDDVVRKATDKLLDVPGVLNTVAFSGFSGSGSPSSNGAMIFVTLKPMNQRRHIDEIIGDMRKIQFEEAFVASFAPQPVSGGSNSGGFEMVVQDRGGKGPVALGEAAWILAQAANKEQEISSAFTFFETNTPGFYLDIDREKARRLRVGLQDVFSALQNNLGSAYVNDFNFLGQTYRVMGLADAPYRSTDDDVLNLRVRSAGGKMIPIGSFASLEHFSGPVDITRYNLYPSATLSGDTTPGVSSGRALAKMEELADTVLPDGFGYEWTGLTYQEKKSGNTAVIIFSLAVLFVFLLLSAQYESWTLPLGIILIVPMCLFSAGVGLLITGMDNDILTQIGFLVLVGLASKNAILIVEFAKQNEDETGMDPYQAAIEACKTRLRPILMTALSFILGVVPLLFASGPGFEMRQAIGITVFSGMIGVTVFGLLFTPVFYTFCRKLAALGKGKKP